MTAVEDNRFRILFVTGMNPSREFPLRGVIIRRQAKALRELGHLVEIIEVGGGHGPLRYLTAQSRVSKAIDTSHHHVVHVHFGYGILAVPPTRLPIVTTFYGDDLQGTADARGQLTWKSRLGIVVSHVAAWRSREVVVVSAALRERLWFRSLRERARVVRDAVDPGLFRPLSRDMARQRLQIPDDGPVVIFPHDISQPTKRLWLAQDALDCLKTELPLSRLWVVNGVPPDEMPWYYAAADAMIVTSLLEAGPSSAKEALACGIPVVSVPVGDLQLAAEAPATFRVSEADPHALARVLREVITQSRIERQSTLPRELTLAQAARTLSDIYETALKS